MSCDLTVLKYSSSDDVLKADTASGICDGRIDCRSIGNQADISLSDIVPGDVSFGNIGTESEDFQAYPFMAKINQGALENKDFSELGHDTVYPNPATDYIGGESHGSIYNIVGQKIKDNAINSMLSGWESCKMASIY